MTGIKLHVWGEYACFGGAALQLDGGLVHLFAFQRRSGHAGDERQAAR